MNLGYTIYTIGDRLLFFHCAIEQDYFLSQNQSKEIFFYKNPSLPPPAEYQMDLDSISHSRFR